MSESDILLNYSQMDQAAQYLQSQAGNIQTLVDDLGSSLQPLFQTWGMTGSQAAEAMQQDENNLKNTIGDIVSLLNQFSTSVTNAQVMQAQVDKTNAGMFGSA